MVLALSTSQVAAIAISASKGSIYPHYPRYDALQSIQTAGQWSSSCTHSQWQKQTGWMMQDLATQCWPINHAKHSLKVWNSSSSPPYLSSEWWEQLLPDYWDKVIILRCVFCWVCSALLCPKLFPWHSYQCAVKLMSSSLAKTHVQRVTCRLEYKLRSGSRESWHSSKATELLQLVSGLVLAGPRDGFHSNQFFMWTVLF